MPSFETDGYDSEDDVKYSFDEVLNTDEADEDVPLSFDELTKALTILATEGYEVTGFDVGFFVSIEGDETVAQTFLSELNQLALKYEAHDIQYRMDFDTPDAIIDRSAEETNPDPMNIFQDELGFVQGAAFIAPPEDDDERYEFS